MAGLSYTYRLKSSRSYLQREKFLYKKYECLTLNLIRILARQGMDLDQYEDSYIGSNEGRPNSEYVALICN